MPVFPLRCPASRMASLTFASWSRSASTCQHRCPVANAQIARRSEFGGFPCFTNSRRPRNNMRSSGARPGAGAEVRRLTDSGPSMHAAATTALSTLEESRLSPVREASRESANSLSPSCDHTVGSSASSRLNQSRGCWRTYSLRPTYPTSSHANRARPAVALSCSPISSSRRVTRATVSYRPRRPLSRPCRLCQSRTQRMR